MEWVDSHIHLEDEAFAPDRSEVLARARAVGVTGFLNAGSNAAANRAAQELAAREPDVFAAAGFHPHEFSRDPATDLSGLPDALAQDRVVALGEIGLDYHVFPDYPPPDRASQQAGFRHQVRLARRFELPVIVHVREAMEDALRVLGEDGPFPAGGVLHCYAGTPERVNDVLALGLSIGVGGPVTYPRNEALRQALRAAPPDRVLVETDAPYLPPQAHRGRRNEPAWLPDIGAALAECLDLAPGALAEATTAHARRLFRMTDGDPGTVVYAIREHLYVNLTNRCSSACVFCPRQTSRQVQEHELTLRREPGAAEILAAMGDPAAWREIVFCGFGEPVLRLPVLLHVAQEVKARGGRVRVNTNGQADLLFGRDILPDCRGRVDEWSVSLNAADPERYARLVRPTAGSGAFAAVCGFIERAVQSGFRVTVTAVGRTEAETADVADLARRLGARFRGRTWQRLGEPEDL